jgi:2-keto-4-pentenoate hydratase/2-oxohepta-3-ene-1,7-dioic acid hydratase in catechol pathway
MRWATYQHRGDNVDRVGLVVDDEIYGLEPGIALVDLLGDDGERLARAGEQAKSSPAEVVAYSDVRIRPPIPRPPAVRDFFAFEQHVKAGRDLRGLPMDPDWYEMPVFYFTNPHAINGSGDDIPMPPGCNDLDYELEFGVIVGRTGANLSPDQAESYIAGYTIFNDWSARDIQAREMQQGLGPHKGKDTATTLGPVLVTRDELQPYRKGQAFDLTMTAKVNGKDYSRAKVSDIYWSFEEMLAYASRGTRVEPGDVFGSGTCGTGCIYELSLRHGLDAYPWLKPGDEVELTVEQIGTIRNRVVPGPPLIPLRPAK